MTLDAIIIADAGSDTFSGTNPLKLHLDGRIADIQTVKNFVSHHGRITPPVEDADRMNWAASPKLNGIYLLNYLSRHDFKIKLINSYYEQRDEFIALLKESPRAIVISTTFIVEKRALVILTSDIRTLCPDIPIVVGGPYIRFSYDILTLSSKNDYIPEENKKDHLFLDFDEEPQVDLYIISTRGEAIAREALRRIRDGQNLDGLPNTAVMQDDGYRFSPRIDDRDEPMLPIDWLRLDEEIFKSAVIPIQASNGCPFNCAFCNFDKDRKMTYVKPIDDLVEEILQVHRRGVRYIWFVDDNFRLGKGDLETFCRHLIDTGVDISWMTLIRASVLENLDAQLLRRAGCIEVQLGLESADPQILLNMNKKATPPVYEKVVYKMLKAGINCACYLIFGFPGETAESARRTIAFMKQFDDQVDGGTISWSIFPFVLAPLSPIYEPQARRTYGLQGHLRQWRHDTMDAGQALRQVQKAFSAIETSGAIYRSDNQELLRAMSPRQANEFHRVRHRLAKKAISSELTAEEIVRTFQTVL